MAVGENRDENLFRNWYFGIFTSSYLFGTLCLRSTTEATRERTLDFTTRGTNPQFLPDGIEILLVDHLRKIFREDERELESLNKRLEQARQDAERLKSKAKDAADLRLLKLQACLVKANTTCDHVAAELRSFEGNREKCQDLILRAREGRWSKTENAIAKEFADDALSDLKQEIARAETQIEDLRKRHDETSQETQFLTEAKNAAEQQLFLLLGGGTPPAFHEALRKRETDLEAEFQAESEENVDLLRTRESDVLTAEVDLNRLNGEMEAARARTSQMALAGRIGRIARNLDPRNLVWRSEASIRKDIDTRLQELDTASADVERIRKELADLRATYETELEALPESLRGKLIDETKANLSVISNKLANIERMVHEIKSELEAHESELSKYRKEFEVEHQRHVTARLDNMLCHAQTALDENEKEIDDAAGRLQRAEQIRARFLSMIDGRRARLEAALADCDGRARAHLEPLQRAEARLRRRLQDRAQKAGMVHDPKTGTFREQEVPQLETAVARPTYRRRGEALSSLATLPVLLQRREQTGYVSKDDERLATVFAAIRDEVEPSEAERPEFIDRFCDIVFGDDEEERPFFVSLVSKKDEQLLVLVRPAEVLPQLQSCLPEAMSVCLLCRLDYGSRNTPDNTTLLVLDAAVVPDCAPRPFEAVASFLRYTSRRSLPAAAPALDEILEQALALPDMLEEELQDRLTDWQGYLDWANREISRKAPWAALGPGEWEDNAWNGVVICEGAAAVRHISGARLTKDTRRSVELYPLEEPWKQGDRKGRNIRYRCTDFKVIGPATLRQDFLKDCPWPDPKAIQVQLKFSRKADVAALAKMAESTSLGLRDLSEAAGSKTQLDRYGSALTQLQFGASGRRQANRLPAAPYLMASLFNVALAAKPSDRPDRLLNEQIAQMYRLNEDQKAAVGVMLAAPEIAYVQGPPGTGKTTMIAAACAHFVRSGHRVLIASQTNLAVENALDRLRDDPEVRQLWLSKNDGEERKSTAVAEWYGMAAEHVKQKVSGPLKSLTAEVKQLQIWLGRAQKLDDERRVSDADIAARKDTLKRANARLDEVKALQKAASEANRRAAWWGMARNALANLEDWDPSCFGPELAPDVADLLAVIAKHDGRRAHLDVSAHALHGQVRELICDIQSRLRDEEDQVGRERAEGARQRILDAWPTKGAPEAEGSGDDEASAKTEAEADRARRIAQQALDDACSRGDTIHEQCVKLLSGASEFLDLPAESSPSDLSAAIAQIKGILDLQASRLAEANPLEDWLPLLDQWVGDLKQQAEKPSATDRMGERYVRSANVIGITCNADFRILSDNGFSSFDVVIVDEVSKATPLELLRPMLLAPKTILVGDHRQLPPTFEFASFSNPDTAPTDDEDADALEREAELLRKYERLTTASLFRDGFAEIDPRSRAALNTQYRMHPQIMSLINRFYDGRLQSGLTDPDGLDTSARWSWRTHGLNLNSRTGGQYLTESLHALWIDSSEDEAGKVAYEDSDGTGIGNKLEARLVAQVVEDLVNTCEREHRTKTIAVATFYNRQKRLIRKELESRLGQRFKGLQIDVETVDRFQGKEADIVIVSMVRNRSRRLGKNSNPAKFERINVAFSRARDLLVVIGARKTFERFEVAIEPVDGGAPRRTPVYGQIIGDIKELGGLWQAKDILGPKPLRSERNNL
ncbi:AAA domain-containing protein [Tropicibacter alexandrii]|uniref:AAA domain-containing protein n=1 Tax=Tropicibacter alexandrii TaxID=2267683 RepID=UPI0010092C9A|nr:AAA domain-containing protein [Tropicibacter alexandrii]